jgi:hypothetical protein
MLHAHEVFIDLISSSARASIHDDENSNDTQPTTTIHQSQFNSLLERLDLLKNCHDLGGSEDEIFKSLDIDQDSCSPLVHDRVFQKFPKNTHLFPKLFQSTSFDLEFLGNYLGIPRDVCLNKRPKCFGQVNSYIISIGE